MLGKSWTQILPASMPKRDSWRSARSPFQNPPARPSRMPPLRSKIPELWTRRALLQMLAASSVGVLAGPRQATAAGAALRLRTHDGAAGRLLSGSLDDPAFWEGASVKTWDDRLYDEVRLKQLAKGYLAMVTGEGNRDFSQDTVVRTVFDNMQRLPEVEDGAKAVVRLGEGTDSATGLPYVDSFYYLDFTLFYGIYAQRMYKLVETGRTILYFEKLSPGLAAAAWPGYDQQMTDIVDSVKRRVIFNGITPVSQIFGMFVVEPGRVHRTRVTFTTKIHFGEGTGAIARMGSEMPMVIRAGLQSGFESCVAIAGKLEPA